MRLHCIGNWKLMCLSCKCIMLNAPAPDSHMILKFTSDLKNNQKSSMMNTNIKVHSRFVPNEISLDVIVVITGQNSSSRVVPLFGGNDVL